ncbi:MAG: helix-turn-helix transcriptional regulator [Bacteroidia bacterium]
MLKTFSNRIEFLIEKLGYKNVSDFSKALGYAQSEKVSRLLRDENNKPSFDIIQDITNKFEKVNIKWLITGVGNWNTENNKTISVVTETNNEKHLKNVVNRKFVPLIPIDAFAGYTGDSSTVLERDISEQYVVPDFKNVDFLIRVRGNSMYPKYASGDVVACRILKDWAFFQWGKVYVIDTEQGVLVKRIKKSSEKDCVLAISENKEVYEPFDLPRSSIRNLALVIGVIRLE